MAKGGRGCRMLVRIYEEGDYKAQTTADASGSSRFTWGLGAHAHLSHGAGAYHSLRAGRRDVQPALAQRLAGLPRGGLVPTALLWEGDANGLHHTSISAMTRATTRARASTCLASMVSRTLKCTCSRAARTTRPTRSRSPADGGITRIQALTVGVGGRSPLAWRMMSRSSRSARGRVVTSRLRAGQC